MFRGWLAAAAVAAALLAFAIPARAQQEDLPVATVCGQQARPAAQPPAGTAPVVLFIAPCFEAQGNASVIESQTYLYYIQLKPSSPSQGVWVPYDDAAEKMITEDFRRLWNTNFLDNLSIDVDRLQVPQRHGRQDRDVQHGGAAARQDRRLHRVEEGRDLEDRREAEGANAQIRLDTFIDPALIRKVEGIVQDMLQREGLPVRGGHPENQRNRRADRSSSTSRFNMDEGPKVKIRRIDFVGNTAIGDSTLKKQMKENKERRLRDSASLDVDSAASPSTYQETKFDEDAEKLVVVIIASTDTSRRTSACRS